MDNYY